MKNQALFSSKDKSKKSKCRLVQFLFGALRVKLDKVHQKCFNISADNAYMIYFHSNSNNRYPSLE